MFCLAMKAADVQWKLPFRCIRFGLFNLTSFSQHMLAAKHRCPCTGTFRWGSSRFLSINRLADVLVQIKFTCTFSTLLQPIRLCVDSCRARLLIFVAHTKNNMYESLDKIACVVCMQSLYISLLSKQSICHINVVTELIWSNTNWKWLKGFYRWAVKCQKHYKHLEYGLLNRKITTLANIEMKKHV